MRRWGNPKEVERRNRIRLTLAAYAYEFMSNSIMSDAEFDDLSKKINPNETTGKRTLDRFFRDEFHPDTGMWIRSHPELDKVHALYVRLYAKETDQ
nr:hypothetical protein [uncultured Cohaesibacter sp.]